MLERMAQAAQGSLDPLETDVDFHLAILEASNNQFFYNMSPMIETALNFSIRFTNKQLHRRVGDIGHAVQEHAEGAGYAVVREFVGHGIGTSLHEDPQVPNYGPPGRRERLVAGMCLAIEAMVNVGGPDVKVLSDGWTAVTTDGSLSAHFELSVAVMPEGPWVLSEPYPYAQAMEAHA